MRFFSPSHTAPDKLLALAGILIVVAEVYIGSYSPLHALFLAIGILAIYVGSWRFTGRLIHRRANTALRGEVDRFVSLVRQLYTDRTEGDAASLHQTKAELRECYERIINAAVNYQEPTEGQDTDTEAVSAG
jgi:hypothetical protein